MYARQFRSALNIVQSSYTGTCSRQFLSPLVDLFFVDPPRLQGNSLWIRNNSQAFLSNNSYLSTFQLYLSARPTPFLRSPRCLGAILCQIPRSRTYLGVFKIGLGTAVRTNFHCLSNLKVFSWVLLINLTILTHELPFIMEEDSGTVGQGSLELILKSVFTKVKDKYFADDSERRCHQS